MFSMFYAQGTTNGNARQGRGGINTTHRVLARPATSRAASTSTATRWAWTPGSGWGRSRSIRPSCTSSVTEAVIAPDGCPVRSAAARSPGRKYYSDIDAWLIDVRGGFQLGPLLLEGLAHVHARVTAARNNTLGTRPLLPAADHGHGLPGRLGLLAHVAGYRLPQRLERGWRPDRIPRRQHRLGQVRAHAVRRQGHLRDHPGPQRHGRCERALDGREGGSQRHGGGRRRASRPVFTAGCGTRRVITSRYVGTELHGPDHLAVRRRVWRGTTSSATCSWARRWMG